MNFGPIAIQTHREVIMGRPKLNKTRFVLSFPPALLEAVDAIAAATHSTRSDLIQRAVEEFVKKHAKLDAIPKRKAARNGN